LRDLKDQFREDFPVGPLIGKCCTMEQVNSMLMLSIFSPKNIFLVSYVET